MLILASAAQADTVKFPDYNFSVDTPAGWKQLKPTKKEMTYAAISADGKRQVIVAGNMLPDPRSAPIAVQSALNVLKKAGVEKKWVVTTPPPLECGSMHCTGMWMDVGGGRKSLVYAGAAGAGFYMFTATSTAGDPQTDADVQAFLGSFRLLAVPAIVEPAVSGTSLWRDPERLGKLTGGIIAVLVIALCGVVIVRLIVWVFRKPKAK